MKTLNELIKDYTVAIVMLIYKGSNLWFEEAVMIFKELETERLYLKNIGYDDIPFIFKEFSTDEVNDYLYDAEPVISNEAAKCIVDFYLKDEMKSRHRLIIK